VIITGSRACHVICSCRPGHLAVLSAIAPGPADEAGAGLLEALSQVPDPRDRRGVRYGLAAVLAAAVCATLAGARSYSAIAEWVHDAAPQQRAALGLHGQIPDLVTIWRVLTAVDPAALDRVIGAWVAAQLPAGRPQARVVLAVDGKTLRGARTASSPAQPGTAAPRHPAPPAHPAPSAATAN
jgi:hypothetical protein